MPKTYAAGDKVLATEYNEVVKTAGLYAASSAGSDTYAITVTPTPGSYAAGDVYHFKADVANTGAATLNVNSLGAKTIKKNLSGSLVDLDTNDIIASQFCDVIYDGTQFQLLSQRANSLVKTHGTATRAGNTASGSQTIAHGLGKVPSYVIIKAMYPIGGASAEFATSDGAYNGSTTSCVYLGLSGAGSVTSGVDTTNIIYLVNGAGSNSQVATVTVDSTNITLSWTKAGSPNAANMNLRWEAYA